VSSGPVLQSWDGADECLRHIALRQIALTKLETTLQTGIDRLKALFGEKVDQVAKEKKSLERDLEQFVAAHRADLGKAQSKRLTFGRVGFRRVASLALSPGMAWDKVLEHISKLPRACRRQFIRVKESVNKEAIRQAELSELELEGMGLELREKETFGYTLDEAKLQEVAEAKAAAAPVAQ